MLEDQLYDEWIPLNQREKLSLGLIFAISCSNLIQGLAYNVLNAIIVPSIRNLGFGKVEEKIILLIGSFVGFFMAPLLGVFSDRLMFKYGRRRIFVVIGTIFTIVSLLLLAFHMNLGKTILAQKAIFIFSVVLSYVSINTVQQPARVMCSDLTPPSQQNLMASICQLFGGLAPLISNLMGGFPPDIPHLSKEKFLLIITSVFSFVAMIISCIAAREEPLRVRPPKVNPFSQIYNAFKKIPRAFKRVILPFLFANVAIFQFAVLFTDFMGEFFVNNGKNEDKGMSFGMLSMAVNNVVQLVYSFVNNKVCELTGFKWAMVVGNVILAVCLFLFKYVKDNEYYFFPLYGCIGLSQVIFTTIPYTIVSLVIPSDELGNNFGILNCFCVFGQQISNWGLGLLIDKFGKSDFRRKKIYYSSIFGVLAAFSSLWILQPSLAEAGNYNQIPDESGTGGINGLSEAE